MSSVTPLTSNIPSLPERWASCSEGRDGARHVQTSEALALARAVDISLERNRPTADLTRTAREWGARLPSPSAVVSAVASLREAVFSLHVPAIPIEQAPIDRSDGRSSGQIVLLPVGQADRSAGEPDLLAERALDQGGGDDNTDGGAPATEIVVPAGVLKVLDRVLSEAIEGVSSSLREAALIDPLTGCANRRALREDLDRAVAGARRTGLDVAVAVIDLDGLKQINDTNGHAAGDSTLQDLANSLKAAVRDTDAVYRVGGDEFVVLIPFSGTGGAAAAMQRAKAEGAPKFSWGASSLSMLPAGSEIDKLIDMADTSLYATRRNVRPITSARPRRHRTALVGAAAAAVVGLGVASAFELPSSPQQAAIGAPAPSGVNDGGGHASPGQTHIAVPPARKSDPAASHTTVGTGESGSQGIPGSSQLSEIPAEQQAELTVATVSTSNPAGNVTQPTSKPKPSTHPGSTNPGGSSGQSPGTPPLPGRRPHPPGVGKPKPGRLPWTVHPRHPGQPGPHGRGGGHQQGHGEQGNAHHGGGQKPGNERGSQERSGIRMALRGGLRNLPKHLHLGLFT
jgi:diguanylate cyclase (GGDEF)-like protein